ncbi:hypothetical protein SAMN04487904_10172 [Actinopolyspora lacussalsi subsp. righensis]|uniref:Uncharacterized protein n=1 Tax=Actinopolyspora righensis TaxID=995060 RepID=A0A1I6X2Y1_9ACTN|nr:hypothetical protein SAMN04487904_10172 [Actinopolyspora righensis]
MTARVGRVISLVLLRELPAVTSDVSSKSESTFPCGWGRGQCGLRLMGFDAGVGEVVEERL